MLRLKLEGHTYQYIATEAGVSRQRIQQLLSPPVAIRNQVIKKHHGKCANCGLLVGIKGDIHHKGAEEETYDDLMSLELLCKSCHRIEHNVTERNHQAIGEKNNYPIITLTGFTPEMKLRIKLAALEARLSPSAWVRQAIESKLES